MTAAPPPDRPDTDGPADGANGSAEGPADGADASRAASEAVRRLFEETYGTVPAVTTAAPGRVNLIGEHTDYTGGLVLPLALPQVTEVAATRRDDGVLALYSADRPGPVTLRPLGTGTAGKAESPRGDWTDYPMGVALALTAAGHPVGGASLVVRSSVPTGAGLSSSAALEVACALALATLYGHRLDGVGLAAVGRRAEQGYVGMPCGVMDQLASACCGAGRLLLIDTAALPPDTPTGPGPATPHGAGRSAGPPGRSGPAEPPEPGGSPRPAATAEDREEPERAADTRGSRGAAATAAMTPLPFDPAAAGLRLLVIDTRVTHALTDSGYADRRARCEEATAALGVGSLREVTPAGLDAALGRLPAPSRPLVRHVVTENQRVIRVADALRAGDPRAVGPVLSAGHASLRDDFRVSCDELDTVVDAAVTAGALGARMTGGGFGGSAIALTEVAAVPAVTRAVRAAARAAGQPEPRVFEAVPSDGARVLHRGAA